MFRGNTSKIQEGQEHFTKGQKALKTSFWSFKFSPDYEIGALEFNQAAQCFQASGNHAHAIESYQRVADIREKQADAFGAGRAYEAAGVILEQLNKYNELVGVWKKAVDSYRNAGKVDTAARLLQKVAVMQSDVLRNVDASEAAYEQCLELYENEDKPHYVSEVYKSFINFLASHRRFEKLVKVLQDHMEVLAQMKQHSSLFKSVLCLVVIHLHLGDAVAADNSLSDVVAAVDAGFLDSREFTVGSLAVDTYRNGDAEMFGHAMRGQTWTYLPVEIARLAKQLNVSGANELGGKGGEPRAFQREDEERSKREDHRGEERQSFSTRVEELLC